MESRCHHSGKIHKAACCRLNSQICSNPCFVFFAYVSGLSLSFRLTTELRKLSQRRKSVSPFGGVSDWTYVAQKVATEIFIRVQICINFSVSTMALSSKRVYLSILHNKLISLSSHGLIFLASTPSCSVLNFAGTSAIN